MLKEFSAVRIGKQPKEKIFCQAPSEKRQQSILSFPNPLILQVHIQVNAKELKYIG